VTEPASGLLVVDKPAGSSSHGVVGRVRRVAGTRKVGHAGTLDPMATGVLVLGINRGTRLLHYLVGADKEYTATVRLGVSTTTDDADGEVVSLTDASGVDEDRVRAATLPLTGDIDQVPSAVSAIKVDGRRAYARVRSGEDVTLAPRRVTVSRLDVLAVRPVGKHLDVDVAVACSSGTYVRALARDLGVALGLGGHLTVLRRTRVGPFTLDDARVLDDVEPPIEPALLSLGEAATRFLPQRVLSSDEADRARHGIAPAPSEVGGPIALLDERRALVAVAENAGPCARLRAVFVG
jgi:tRNA pseudouridine55 synthase